MLAAILKASYNFPKDTNVVGGVCGTAFFIDEKNVITANHLFNLNEFKPNNSFLYCKFWLLLENGQTLTIEKDYLKSYPNVDTTKICFPIIVYKDSLNYKTVIAKKGDKFILKGFLASVPENPKPQTTLSWNEQGELIISSFNLDSVISIQEGVIEEVKKISLKSKDIIINEKIYLTLSCGGNTGLSGAPLVKSDTGEVMGLMSFGLPVNVVIKEKLFSISIDEVEKEIYL
jgi:hypothetical protein